MIINGVAIENTFAEAFRMTATRVLITALNRQWALQAAQTMTGFATSVIGCGIEAGMGRELSPEETPDGRPGITVLLFATSGTALTKQLETRVGQCVLTCPTTAVFAAMGGPRRIPLGKNLRYFGDGFQISKRIDGKRYWRIPVMDGEFVCEETTARCEAIGGGNFLVLAESQAQNLNACEAAVEAMRALPNVIMPFPGGVVRSGSKVGSKYKGLMASTNDAYCPTLRGATHTSLGPEIESVMEIVVNGLSSDDIREAMQAGINAVCALGSANGIRAISAGNYGGKLGQFQFHLWEILS
jgi:formylmethanofuran--tetrahydromethanopterin N-formyltransferase